MVIRKISFTLLVALFLTLVFQQGTSHAVPMRITDAVYLDSFGNATEVTGLVDWHGSTVSVGMFDGASADIFLRKFDPIFTNYDGNGYLEIQNVFEDHYSFFSWGWDTQPDYLGRTIQAWGTAHYTAQSSYGSGSPGDYDFRAAGLTYESLEMSINIYQPSGGVDRVTLSAQAVPEPSTMLLLGSALLCLWGFRKKFRK